MKKLIAAYLIALVPMSLFAQTKFTAPVQPPSGTVSQLPTASSWPYGLMWVTDGNSSSDCTTGSGSTKVLCYSTGSAWAAASSGGGSVSASAPYITISGTKYLLPGMYQVTAPPTSGWTGLNSQTITTGAQGELLLTSVGTTGGNFYGMYRTITSNTLEVALSCNTGSGGSTSRTGVGARASGGTLYTAGPIHSNSGGTSMGYAFWTNETTFSDSYDTALTGLGSGITYVKVVYNGSNSASYSGSADGINWFSGYTSKTITANGWVFGVQGSGNGALNNSCVIYSWKEY